MAPDADDRTPGAAVTMSLCGSLDHDPPCPLASHHTRVDRRDDELHVRILFAAEPELEETVRQRIDAALSAGSVVRLDGGTTRWTLRLSRRRGPEPGEAEHLARLTGN
jgi:hypothetical protein